MVFEMVGTLWDCSHMICVHKYPKYIHVNVLKVCSTRLRVPSQKPRSVRIVRSPAIPLIWANSCHVWHRLRAYAWRLYEFARQVMCMKKLHGCMGSDQPFSTPCTSVPSKPLMHSLSRVWISLKKRSCCSVSRA